MLLAHVGKPKATHCKRGHARTPDNVAENGNCRKCLELFNQKRREERAAQHRGPRVHKSGYEAKRRRYLMCGRCGHRWFDRPPKETEYRAPRLDYYGFSDHIPPKEQCPECGSRYNVRYYLDVHISASEGKAPNLDPFSGAPL